MKIVTINGQNHKGSTYHIGKRLAEKLEGEVKEFFLPRDFSEYCTGCVQCIMESEKKCPHYEKLEPILKAMDEADVLIFTSPVYVFHTAAPMKNFLDHQANRWMVHRPRKEMFTKQAVCITSAAGGGMKSANKDMADSLFFWGVPKIYKIGIAVQACFWQEVSEKKREEIEKRVTKVADKIKRKQGKVKPGIKTRSLFSMFRLIQAKGGWASADARYWQEMGWTKKERPWK